MAFPTGDWQLTANDSASGGADKFSIEDITNSKVPFTVTGNAASNSIFVDATGRVGFRTRHPGARPARQYREHPRRCGSSRTTRAASPRRPGTWAATRPTSSCATSPAARGSRCASGPARRPARSTSTATATSASAPGRRPRSCTCCWRRRPTTRRCGSRTTRQSSSRWSTPAPPTAARRPPGSSRSTTTPITLSRSPSRAAAGRWSRSTAAPTPTAPP